MFKLRFPASQLLIWAEHYYIENDREIEFVLSPNVHKQGYLTQFEFVQICRWKTPRSRKMAASNNAEYIEAVTRSALSTENERLRIEILTLLNGVSWPTASVILHFCHSDPYPILDYRALWSLGVNISDVTYNFDLWWEYTKICRNLALQNNLSMRELDRALWQYSKENQ